MLSEISGQVLATVLRILLPADAPVKKAQDGLLLDGVPGLWLQLGPAWFKPGYYGHLGGRVVDGSSLSSVALPFNQIKSIKKQAPKPKDAHSLFPAELSSVEMTAGWSWAPLFSPSSLQHPR